MSSSMSLSLSTTTATGVHDLVFLLETWVDFSSLLFRFITLVRVAATMEFTLLNMGKRRLEVVLAQN